MRQPKYLATIAELSSLAGSSPDEVRGFFDDSKLYRLPNRRLGVPSGQAKRFLQDRGVDYSFRVKSFINLKGGIGKTTSCITIATRLVQYGFKTCVLDLDSQGSAGLAFGLVPDPDDLVFCDVWQRPDELLIGALKRIDHNLYILPSTLDNGLLDLQLVNPASQKGAVKDVCRVLAENGFDRVLIDCPPALGTAVISTICAADSIIIPICSDAFSFHGLRLSLQEITSICEVFNLTRPRIKVLLTKFDRRFSIADESLTILQDEFHELGKPHIVKTSSDFSKALAEGQTIFASHKKSSAKEDYDRIIRSFLIK